MSQSWVTLIMMIRYSYTQTFINMAQRTYCHRHVRKAGRTLLRTWAGRSEAGVIWVGIGPGRR